MSRSAVTLADCTDFLSAPIKEELITFDGPVKIDKGAVVNLLYAGRPLHLKLPSLVTPWGARRGGDDPLATKGPVKLQLELPEATARADFNALLAALKVVDAAINAYVAKNAERIFGDQVRAQPPRLTEPAHLPSIGTQPQGRKAGPDAQGC